MTNRIKSPLVAATGARREHLAATMPQDAAAAKNLHRTKPLGTMMSFPTSAAGRRPIALPMTRGSDTPGRRSMWPEHPISREVHVDVLLLDRRGTALHIQATDLVARLAEVMDALDRAPDGTGSISLPDSLRIARACLEACRTDLESLGQAVEKAQATLDLVTAVMLSRLPR